MLLLLIIFLEVIILLLLSRIIPGLLVSLFYFFVRNQKVSVWFFAVIFLPGTLIHELAHLLTAGMLLVGVGDISLLPEIRESGVKLGHVEISKTDPIRRSLIGFAPVFAGLAVLTSSVFFANANFFQKGEYPIWLILALFYLVVVIGNTMFSSRKDMEGSLFVIICFVAIFGAFYLLGFHQIFFWIGKNLVFNHLEFYKNFAYFLALPVLTDIFLYLIMKFLIRKIF